MKKVVIISTSLRAGSNSEILARRFMEGAVEAGHDVQWISLKGKSIAFCKGCLACQKTGKCVIHDDALAIADAVSEADVVVWATPIYYYELSGQMKTLIDRMNSLYVRENRFREVYLLATAAEGGDQTFEVAENGLNGWVSCFDDVAIKGHCFLGGLDEPNQALNDSRLEEAFLLGKTI